MKGKNKKVIAVSFVAIMVMVAFLGVVSAVTIEHHTMCKGTEDSIVTVHGGTGHASSPVNETTEFYVTDSRALCLVQIKQINRSDTFRFEWFDPRDLLYEVDNSSTDPYFRCWFGIYSDRKTSYETEGYKILQLGTVNVSPPQLGWGTCWVSRSLRINGYPPANKIGNWHVDFYYNDEKQFTETFTISDSIPESGAPTIQTKGDIDINEIMYNPPGADTDNEWLELYNNDTTDIDITGWRFYEAGINHSLTLIQGSRIIPAGGYAIIADNATTFLDVDEECNCTVIDSAFSLNNSGEYIALKNATLGIIDEVAYNASWGADGNNRTLELNATGGWEESRVDGGTPCQQNSVLASDLFEDSRGGIQDEEPACAEFEELSEDISVDTTLDGCYRITDSIKVRDGAVLTVEPGSVLHFEQDIGLEITSKSALKAVGEADSKIWFTGEQKTKGYWKGISFDRTDSTDNVLDNVIIEYGGGDYWSFGGDESNLNVYRARVRVTNTKIWNSGGWGFYFYHTDVTEFNNNVITSNTKGAGCLYSANDAEDIDSSSTYTGNDKDIVFVDSGTVEDDQTWPAIDVPYLFDGDIEVESQVTIEAGATLSFAQDASILVRSSGSLNAEGTETEPILFTGEQKTKGYWKGICFDGTDSTDNVLDNVIIEYGGGDYWSFGGDESNLNVYRARVRVTNTKIWNSGGYGIYNYYGDLTKNNIEYNDNSYGNYYEYGA